MNGCLLFDSLFPQRFSFLPCWLDYRPFFCLFCVIPVLASFLPIYTPDRSMHFPYTARALFLFSSFPHLPDQPAMGTGTALSLPGVPLPSLFFLISFPLITKRLYETLCLSILFPLMIWFTHSLPSASLSTSSLHIHPHLHLTFTI